MIPATRLFGGVDGGGTKTWAVVGDDSGRLLGFGAGGPTHYHVFGLDLSLESMMTALTEAVKAARAALKTAPAPGGGGAGGEPGGGGAGGTGGEPGVGGEPSSPLAALTRAAFYLAGDDSKDDHAAIGEGLAKTLPPGVAFQWDNDSWAALRGGTRKGWGAVCVSGTGSNSAALSPDGRRAILRGLGRDIGSPGGASDLAREAVFWAFRMDEGMRPRTSLHGAILEALGLPDYDAVVREYNLNNLAFGYRAMGVVAPLVFRLATEGDEVAQLVLTDMGRLMGEQTGAVIKRAGIDRLETDVVLAGGTWRGDNPLLIDAFTMAVHRAAPKARPALPLYQPVVGAYLLALEGSGVTVGPETYANLARTIPGLLPEPGPAVAWE